LAHGDLIQALVQNQGGPPDCQQGTAVQAHLPADALRVLGSTTRAGGESSVAAPRPPSVSVTSPPSLRA